MSEENRLSCAVVRDLLPLCADGLASAETKGAVFKHLETCADCKEIYKNMTENIEPAADADEIDYMKTVRKKSSKKAVFAALGALVAVLTALFVKFYCIGSPTDNYTLTYLEPTAKSVRFGMHFNDPNRILRRVTTAKDGSVVLYSGLPLPWEHKRAFNVEMEKPQDGVLNIGGATVEKNGEVISAFANRLYSTKTPYVGDISAIGKVARALNVTSLGSFKNELLTDSEPYVWIMKFENEVSNPPLFEEKMQAYACVLISLIDNLGEVRAEYTAKTEHGTETKTVVYTKEMCDKMAGADVKFFATSAKDVQNLIKILGLDE